MPSKDDIIYEIDQIEPSELVKYIKEEKVTIPEILNENPDDFHFRKREKTEELLWEDVRDSSTRQGYELYLKNYPRGRFVLEARIALERIESGHKDAGEEFETDFEPEAEEDNGGAGWASSFSGSHGFTYPEPEPEDNVDPWNLVNKNSIPALKKFRETYPEHENYAEAGKLINELRKKNSNPYGPEWLKEELLRVSAEDQGKTVVDAIKTKKITTKDFLNLIGNDHNFVNLQAMQTIMNSGWISGEDLIDKAHISPEFINLVEGKLTGLISNKVETEGMTNPTETRKKVQEIYFWGMPASGKTCALGAILSAAISLEDEDFLVELSQNCKGYGYMRQLSDAFRVDSISELPPGTDEDFVADMSIDLVDRKKGKRNSITLIDLAGEMLNTMRLMDEGRSSEISENARAGYECMMNLLVNKASRNAKIHFFVLEYGGHDREHKGIRQADLADVALTHILNNNVFKNSDAVYILMTKADLAFKKAGDRDVNDVIEEYLETHYSNFYRRLKYNAEKHYIRRVEFQPFTIGEVCFKKYCKFDPTTAEDVIDLFRGRTRSEKTGVFGKAINILRK